VSRTITRNLALKYNGIQGIQLADEEAPAGLGSGERMLGDAQNYALRL
jgi:hypothetical protein